MSVKIRLTNYTPFSAERFLLPDKDGQEVVLVVVSATFKAGITEDALEVANEQAPVRSADEHYADAETSSLRYESCMVLEKPRVDVLVNGNAYAPGGKPASKVVVSIQVGDIRKSLVVHGDRRSNALRSPTVSRFIKMPIRYERAYGGVGLHSDSAKQRTFGSNPIGIGFEGAKPCDLDIQTDLPNVEFPGNSSPSDREYAAGFGAIARWWQPRLRYAGTYDQRWLEERWPLLPDDFDVSFNQTAPRDQQSATLKGGEYVTLVNLTPSGQWCFRLPRLDIPVHLIFRHGYAQSRVRCDTVCIDSESFEVVMISRVSRILPRDRNPLTEIVLGHMFSGWVRARSLNKRYLNEENESGRDLSRFEYIL